MTRQCVPNFDVLSRFTRDNYEEMIKDPEMYQAMDGFCLSKHGKTVNKDFQNAAGDNFLDGQCISRQYQTFSVEIMARKNGQDWPMKVHFDAHNYSAIYQVHGVKELFCRNETFRTTMKPALQDNLDWLKTMFLDAQDMSDLYFWLCE